MLSSWDWVTHHGAWIWRKLVLPFSLGTVTCSPLSRGSALRNFPIPTDMLTIVAVQVLLRQRYSWDLMGASTLSYGEDNTWEQMSGPLLLPSFGTLLCDDSWSLGVGVCRCNRCRWEPHAFFLFALWLGSRHSRNKKSGRLCISPCYFLHHSSLLPAPKGRDSRSLDNWWILIRTPVTTQDRCCHLRAGSQVVCAYPGHKKHTLSLATCFLSWRKQGHSQTQDLMLE